jgi:hypothetical protein
VLRSADCWAETLNVSHTQIYKLKNGDAVASDETLLLVARMAFLVEMNPKHITPWPVPEVSRAQKIVDLKRFIARAVDADGNPGGAAFFARQRLAKLEQEGA